MNKFNKYSLVLVFSLLALILYISIQNSNKINAIILLLQESESPRNLMIFIFIHIGKWFLLAFGAIGLIFWLFKMLIKKE